MSDHETPRDLSIARLDLKPGDTLVVKSLHPLSTETQARIKDQFRNEIADPAGARVIVLDAGLDLAVVSKEPPSLAIVLQGGQVQAIVSDRPGEVRLHAIYVVDYDCDGVEHDHTMPVIMRGKNGATISQAIVHEPMIEDAEIDLAAIARELDARADRG